MAESSSSSSFSREEIPLPQFPAATATAGTSSGLTTPGRQQRQGGEAEDETETLAATQSPSPLQQMQQPFVSRRVYEERVYVQPKTLVEEQIVEVPRVEYRDCVVETPQTVFLEKVRAVPRVQVQHRLIHVPKPVMKDVAVEVPHIQWQEKIVEIPTPIYQEKVIPVPKPVIQEQVVYVPRPVIEEKTVEVPRVVYRPLPIEKVVEVPEYRYVYKDEQRPPQQVYVVPPPPSSPTVPLLPLHVARDDSSRRRKQKTCCFGLVRVNEGADTPRFFSPPHQQGTRGVRTPESPWPVSRGREDVTRSRMRLKTAPTLQPINLNVVVKKGQQHRRGGRWAAATDSGSRGRDAKPAPFLNLFECCSFPLSSVESPRTPSTRSGSVSPRVRYVYYPPVGDKIGAAVPPAGRATVPVAASSPSTPRFYSRPGPAVQQTARVRYASAPPPPCYYYMPAAAAGAAATVAGPTSPRGDVTWDTSGNDVAQAFAQYAEQQLPAPEPLIQTRLGIMRFVDFEALNNANALYAPTPPSFVLPEGVGQQLVQQQLEAGKGEEKESPAAATSRSQEWPSLRVAQQMYREAEAERRQAAGGSEGLGEQEGKTDSEKVRTIGGTGEPGPEMDAEQQRGRGETAAEQEGSEEQRSVLSGGAEGRVKHKRAGKKTAARVAGPAGPTQEYWPDAQQLEQQRRQIMLQHWRWEQEKIEQERQRLQEATKIREQQIWRLQQQQRQVQQQLLEQQRAFEAEQLKLQAEQQRLRETIRRRQYENLAAALQRAPVQSQQFVAGTRRKTVMPGAFATIPPAWAFPVYSSPRPAGLPAAGSHVVAAAAPARPSAPISFRYARPAAETGARVVYSPAAFLPRAVPAAPPSPLRPAVVAAPMHAAAAVAGPRPAVALRAAAAAAVPFPAAAATPQPAGLYRMYVVPHIGQPLSSSSGSARAAAAAVAKNSGAPSDKPVPLIPIDVSALRAIPAEPDDLVGPAAAEATAAAGPAARGRTGGGEAAGGASELPEAAAELSPEAYRREVARQAQEAVQSAYLAGVCVYRSVRDVVRKEIDAALAQEVD